nr:DUF1343 domain-containing protein [Clostridia bacterium]
DRLDGLRLGLVTAPSGVDKFLRSTADIISDTFSLGAVFGAEHGFRGDAQAGSKTGSYRDPELGVQVHSLYGERFAPTKEMLSRLDAVVFDIQDIGSRYYTYISTLTAVMKSCAAQNIPLFVFDRPNPIGLERIEGNILNEEFSSFVGEYAVPVRYGLTIGEYAGYINGTRSIGCDLTVVPCEGLTRSMYYDDTGLPFVMPSPNIPTPETALHYVGTCLFEGTNLSEGRGTTRPFELIGAPWLRALPLIEKMNSYRFDGVMFRRAYFRPTFSKYAGELCEGIQIHLTDRAHYQPFEVSLRLIDEIRANFIDFEWNESHIDRLFGDDKLRTEYIGCGKIDDFLAMNRSRTEAFRDSVREYYIY